MKSIYTRLNRVREMFAWDFETGRDWLDEQEQAGRLTAVGVFDETTRVLHVPSDRPRPFENGDGTTDYWAELRALGVEVKRVKVYQTHEHE